MTEKNLILSFAILAAICFTAGGVLMKYADGTRNTGPTVGLVLLFVMGAILHSHAMRWGALGAVYALVLGLEAILAFGLGVLVFQESMSSTKIAGLVLTILGIALLRRG